MTAGLLFASLRIARATPEAALRAESLFREGKDAFERGDYRTACPRLAESQRLEPAGGTLLALALCYEAWGKNATAWALFQEAEAVARRQGRADRERIAKQRAAALEPGLSFITITVEPGAGEPVEVFLDGLRVGEAAYGARTAVDVGSHVLEARHGGERFFVRSVEVLGKQAISVVVPAPPETPRGAVEAPVRTTPPPAAEEPPSSTASAASAPPESPASPAPPASSSVERYLPAALLGVGALGLFVGGYFGVRAWENAREVERQCPVDPCRASLESVHERSKSDAAVATWLMGAGAVATGAGVTLLLFGSPAEPGAATSRRSPVAGPSGAFASWSGSF